MCGATSRAAVGKTQRASLLKNQLSNTILRYRIDVLGIQETRICTLDKKRIGDYTLLTLPAVQERHGIGFAISPRVRPYLQCYWAHCDRIGVVQLLLPHAGPVNIVTAYAPHSGRPLAEVDRFYADLSDTLDQLPRRNITFVTGDFNAKLGHQITGEAFMGPHARGIRNRNGHALADFCSTHLLFATNTGFQKRARHKTTWSQRRTNHCIYNQIDYILCPQNCRRLCVDARSWGGTLTASDHKLVTADFILNAATHRLRYSTIKSGPTLKLARDHLIYDDTARDDYTNALHAALSQPTGQGSTVLQRWTNTLDRIRAAAESTIGLAGPNQRHVRHQDHELQLLSEAQRALQLRIYNDCAANTTELRAARNKILHQIRARCRTIVSRKLDERITRIENLSDSARMYTAVRDISPHRPQPLLLLDQEDHFRTLFYDPGRSTPTPDRESRSLTRPVTATEVGAAFRRLNNGRAAGPDEFPAELLKYGASVLAPLFAGLVNSSFEQGTPLALGEGTLVCLPKPNKPRGSPPHRAVKQHSQGPISRRTRTDIRSGGHIPVPNQSGFRKHRSTADAVWAHKWLCARVQRYRETIHVLGIDLSRAFDTIDRVKLVKVLQAFLHDDEVRLIKVLLADTKLSLRSGSKAQHSFDSNIGTPQGDALSPVLFVIYLEAALRDLAAHLGVNRALLDQMIVYADDADFVCRDVELVQRIHDEAPAVFARWSLQMNATKTELTIIQRCTGSSGYSRHARATEEAWRSTRKLGSLLGDSEDLTRLKILAAGALRRLWTIWIRPQYVSDATRVRLYNCYVLPVLLYNSGTWALTPSELSGLDSFHRRQLRSVLNVRYPQRISNATLYEICQERPLRHRITAARWRLFGHILRRPEIPAYTQMAAYFDSSSKGTWRGCPRTTLPTVLVADLISSGYAYRLQTRHDLEQLRLLAQEKPKWKALERAIAAALPAKKDPTYADTTLCRRLAKLSLATA